MDKKEYEQYKQLTMKDKEEYMLRFVENQVGFNNITLAGVIFMILGTQLSPALTLYGFMVLIFGNIMFWIISYKKSQWIKTKIRS